MSMLSPQTKYLVDSRTTVGPQMPRPLMEIPWIQTTWKP